MFVWGFLLNCQYNTSMFVGIISGKPSRDFTRPLGSPKGEFKRLIAYAKCNRLSHDRGFMFHFIFAKGLAKCKFGGI
jgi:hypothetical protein